jgi:hypothetical protein
VKSWQPSYSQDWDCTKCLQTELSKLYCYEFSRESLALRDRVAFIRHGKIEESSYWSPFHTFGWLEWPEQSYLSIPQAERVQRLEALALADGKVIELLPREQSAKISERDTRTGRASAQARYRDQLRALSVARLRVNYGVEETRQILTRTYGHEPYSDVTALERAKRKAHRFLIRFVLQAEAHIAQGLWFPPFGNHIIRP